MKEYDFQKIEKKWQKRWLEDGTYEPDLVKAKNPFYNLMMFPYPSAEGLHVGNMYAFTGADIYGRMKRMRGYDVFEPIGLDGFGIHSENYALKIGAHPMDQAKISEKRFYEQLRMIGNGFAWNEKVETYNPDYYKWTQWVFTEMWRRGLAYRKKQSVNWCPKDKTVLADEQVIAGKCERCSAVVVKKDMEQWFFRITKYAEKLLKNLDKIDWSERVKIAQRNWIGKSEGALLDFEIKGGVAPSYVLLHGYTGSPKKHFFPWLKKELEKRGAKVYAPELPDAEDPKVYDQAAEVLKSVPFGEDTVLVGHSLGGVVALKVLEKLNKPVRKTVLVTSYNKNKFFNDPFEPHTFDWKFDVKKIKANAGNIHILRDMTDDVVPSYQADNLKDVFGGEIFDFSAATPHAWGKKEKEEPEILGHCIDSLRVFTTRPDTLFGATYMVVAPEHGMVGELKEKITNYKEVEAYVKKTSNKSEEERIEEGKEKTGVELKGIKAVNPVNNEEIPVFIADYVLASYGTGAIMAVPAHDERDYEFAKKYKLPIREVVIRKFGETKSGAQERKTVYAVVKHKDKILLVFNKKLNEYQLPGGKIEDGENDSDTLRREIAEETGYDHVTPQTYLGQIDFNYFFRHYKFDSHLRAKGYLVELNDEHKIPVRNSTGENMQSSEWMEADRAIECMKNGTWSGIEGFIKRATGQESLCFSGDGVLVDSDNFDGTDSEKAKWEITKLVGGERKIQYRLRDWLISRQRYWGAPIPMIHCEACASKGDGEQKEMLGWYAVPEKNLPVELPYVKDFRPQGKGESPLASVKEFYEAKCPHCGGKARRETDVSDTFLDSAWYYLRYPSAKEKNKAWDLEMTKKWFPVNLYTGGAEHSVLHLLYVRFVAMAFHDAGWLDFEEPFPKFRAHGLLIKEGAKMSKSKGNVINPDEYIKKFGADSLRMYLMFLAPFEQGGDFRDEAVLGIVRFLDRVWNLYMKEPGVSGWADENVLRLTHRTIKKITDDIESLHYNTAISALMILLNELEKANPDRENKEVFLKLLAPFAPHITEELWHELGNPASIHRESWPVANPKLLKEEDFDMVVQVNGKLRATVKMPRGIAQKDAEKAALSNENVRNSLAGQKPKKIIFVPDRLINFVV